MAYAGLMPLITILSRASRSLKEVFDRFRCLGKDELVDVVRTVAVLMISEMVVVIGEAVENIVVVRVTLSSMTVLSIELQSASLLARLGPFGLETATLL